MHRDTKLAKTLVDKVKIGIIPKDLLYLRMHVLFLQELITYLQDRNKSADVMEKLTSILRLLGYDDEANSWCQLFKESIKKGHEQ